MFFRKGFDDGWLKKYQSHQLAVRNILVCIVAILWLWFLLGISGGYYSKPKCDISWRRFVIERLTSQTCFVCIIVLAATTIDRTVLLKT